MRVNRVKLTNYRGFESSEFVFDGRSTVVVAGNARGKSNLLEALYYLAVAKSGRGARDADVIRWGSSFYRIDAQAVRGGEPIRLSIAFDPRVGKKAFVDEQPVERLSGFVGVFNAVLFSPEDVDLVLRDPAQRRRLLDVLISQSSASYLTDLDAYRRSLAQRNQLLREQPGRVRKDAGLLIPWEQQLAESGARVIRKRYETLDALASLIDSAYQMIAPTSEELRAAYRSPVKSAERDNGAAVLLEALQERRPRDMERGFTTVGPHRDRLTFELDGREAHRFGSKGQMKSVLLSWKLAESGYLLDRTGEEPVLLMDDVFSELDEERAVGLLEHISGGEQQVFLTTARDPDLAFDRFGYTPVRL